MLAVGHEIVTFDTGFRVNAGSVVGQFTSYESGSFRLKSTIESASVNH